MPRNSSGVYSRPPGTTAIPNATISSSAYNTAMEDLTQDANAPRPVSAGGTGASTAAQARSNLGIASIDSFQNRLINGDFRVAQRGASFGSVVNGTFVADRWQAVYAYAGSPGTANVSTGQVNLGPSVGSGEAYRALFWQQSVAGSGGSYAGIAQSIEGVGTLAGKTAVISFVAGFQVGGADNVSITLQQVFGTGGSPSPTIVVTGPVIPVAVAGSFTRYEATVAIPSIEGKTIGTNGDDRLFVQIGFPTNKVFTILITEIQLEAGTAATGFERRPMAIETQLCQRFFAIQPAVAVSSASGAGVPAATPVYWPSWMRKAPTTTITPGSRSNANTVNLLDVTAKGARFQITATAAGTFAAADTIIADAEF